MHVHPMILEDMIAQFNRIKLEKVPYLESIIEAKN